MTWFPRSITRTTLSAFRQQSQTQAIRYRYFHSTPAVMVQVGDKVPSVQLAEGAPDKKIDLSQELASGKGLVIGVPAAFSPGCSQRHIPEYLAEKEKLKNAGKVFVVAINDAFVMKAWQDSLDPEAKSGVRFLADAGGDLGKAWDTSFDASALLGNQRSKRYAITTEDGKVTQVNIEPDNIGIDVSAAKNNLK